VTGGSRQFLQLEEAEDIERVSTGAERETLSRELTEAEDWLYMDGADSNATEFQDKLGTLRM
jgi:hypothetical protein